MIDSFTYPKSGERLFFLENNTKSIKKIILDILGNYCAPDGSTLSFKTFLEILKHTYKVSFVLERNSLKDMNSMVHNQLVLYELKRQGKNGVRILSALQYSGWLTENGEMSYKKWSELDPHSSTIFQWAYIIEEVNKEIEKRKRKKSRSGLKIGESSIGLIHNCIQTRG